MPPNAMLKQTPIDAAGYVNPFIEKASHRNRKLTQHIKKQIKEIKLSRIIKQLT